MTLFLMSSLQILMFLVLICKWIMQPEDTRYCFQENATAPVVVSQKEEGEEKAFGGLLQYGMKHLCFSASGGPSAPLSSHFWWGSPSFSLLPLWVSFFLSQKLLDRIISESLHHIWSSFQVQVCQN